MEPLAPASDTEQHAPESDTDPSDCLVLRYSLYADTDDQSDADVSGRSCPPREAGDAALTAPVTAVPSVEATDVASRWLADAGASRDMVGPALAQRYPNSIVKAPAI